MDVTPSQSELPKNNFGILDHLYARAIVLDNGSRDRRAGHGGCGRRSRIRSGRRCHGQIEKELEFLRRTSC